MYHFPVKVGGVSLIAVVAMIPMVTIAQERTHGFYSDSIEPSARNGDVSSNIIEVTSFSIRDPTSDKVAILAEPSLVVGSSDFGNSGFNIETGDV